MPTRFLVLGLALGGSPFSDSSLITFVRKAHTFCCNEQGPHESLKFALLLVLPREDDR